ncbi:hypothetical protein Glove_709g74 [Diversispora epigaea]|uniref:Protein kinase domain-containing protein n=1 Tax=Diversispora epigaea TaxID=1348612 RepID=A0A397G7E3_9GLOM|nr:hypothetical protein Glove_709g74 [Diversispora epigaea]
MEDYRILKELGVGTFGTVIQAQHKKTSQVVAIKKMKKKYSSWEKVCELREFRALKSLPLHPNVITLIEAFLLTRPRELYFVFDYMEGSLYQFIKDRKGQLMDARIVQSIMFQILKGLYHIHSHGIFHRDMKPENILISTKRKICQDKNWDPNYENESKCSFNNNKAKSIQNIQNMETSDDIEEYIVKIGDFGLARDIKLKHPYTEYVSTRWYRAPEIILRSNTYSSPIDLWAAGAIMAELFTLKPLFPGKSEIDQLFKISEVLGSPCEKANLPVKIGELCGGEWGEGIKLAKSLGFSFLRIPPKPLSKIFTSGTPQYFIEFIVQILQYDPQRRLSSLEALNHPYFVESNLIFVPPYELEEIKGIRGMEKKRKKEHFLSFRKGGNLIPGDRKKPSQYSWSKALDEPYNTIPFDLLPSLDIEAVNVVREKDFKLPSIESVSSFSDEEKPTLEQMEQQIYNHHHFSENMTENITENLLVDSPTTISSSSLLTSNRSISVSRRILQFSTTVHKRNRSNTMSEVDRIAKEIEEINRNFEPTNSNIYNNNKTAVDFQRYQLPEDVMKFFTLSDDSSPLIKRSYSKSKDFMKIHRRYSSTSAATFYGEISPLSSPTVDFQIHQKKSSIASNQDHYRNDSGFSTNSSTNNLTVSSEEEGKEKEKEKEKDTTMPFFATKHYGFHLQTWKRVNEEELANLNKSSSLNDNDSLEIPIIPEFQHHHHSGNEPDSSTNHNFFANLKTAVKFHSTSSPTKRTEITSSHSATSSSSISKLQSSSNGGGVDDNSQRREKLNNINEDGKVKPAMTKKRSFIFDVAKGGLFSSSSSKESPKEEDSSNDSKRSNFKKERKHNNSSGLFSTLGAKISLH